jgi:hypothetical protein
LDVCRNPRLVVLDPGSVHEPTLAPTAYEPRVFGNGAGASGYLDRMAGTIRASRKVPTLTAYGFGT